MLLGIYKNNRKGVLCIPLNKLSEHIAFLTWEEDWTFAPALRDWGLRFHTLLWFMIVDKSFKWWYPKSGSCDKLCQAQTKAQFKVGIFYFYWFIVVVFSQKWGTGQFTYSDTTFQYYCMHSSLFKALGNSTWARWAFCYSSILMKKKLTIY